MKFKTGSKIGCQSFLNFRKLWNMKWSWEMSKIWGIMGPRPYSSEIEVWSLPVNDDPSFSRWAWDCLNTLSTWDEDPHKNEQVIWENLMEISKKIVYFRVYYSSTLSWQTSMKILLKILQYLGEFALYHPIKIK